MFKILVVEDEYKLRKLYQTVLEKAGFKTIGAANGKEAMDFLDREYIDLMVCDIMMPQMDGYTLTRQTREAGYTFPVLMVTAKDTFLDKQTGFHSGTDDYMTKPIDVNEMVLRVNALLRRAQLTAQRTLTIGGTLLEYDSLAVVANNTQTILPQKEFYILYKLCAQPGKIFTRQQIMDEIWGVDSETEPRTVDEHIYRVREKLRENPDIVITTVRGLGYKVEKKDG